MADERKYWEGSDPSQCQWCGQPVNGVFVDGATRRGWTILCVPCHDANGYGLGTGRGQKYYLMESGQWLKDRPERLGEPNDLTDMQTRLFGG